MPIVALLLTLAVLAVLALGVLYWRRQGYSGPGGETIVRCREGHLFTTVWIPGMSFKAIRLGMMRVQRCPVGHHLSLVVPVKGSELTDEEKRIASEYHDTRIP
jgi:hypothetical protein